MSQRTYLSIGDVLSLLREEFPDVTISKIRFLESQGLVDPERSPSGYRKFYEHDVARLRWVLRAQRDEFLPLKVIRDRLDAAGNGAPPDEMLTATDPSPARRPAHAASAPTEGGAASRPASTSARASDKRAPRPDGSIGAPELPQQLEPSPRAPASAGPEAADIEPGVPGTPERAAAGGDEPEPPAAVGPPELPAVSLTLAELCAATGLAPQAVAALERQGLISTLTVAGTQYYGEDALTVAKLAAAFAHFGIEPRHLRLYRNAADREVGLVEQVITPLLRQRNPEARRRAADAAEELTRLGQSLRASLVRSALHRQIGT